MSLLSQQLSFRARHRLATILDQPNIRGCDWRSIVELMGFSYEMVMMLRNKESPTMSLLEEWELREGSNATIESLIDIIEELDNIPALEALRKIKEDYDKKVVSKSSKSPVSSLGGSDNNCFLSDVSSKKLLVDPVNLDVSIPSIVDSNDSHVKELNQQLQILTLDIQVANESDSLTEQSNLDDDLLLKGHEFDVFLSFSSVDLDFAIEMKLRLSHRAGFSVYMPSEGLMAGQSFQDEIADKIKRCCKKTIIILSPDYIDCSWCNYEARLAHLKNPDPRIHTLIPVMYRKCTVPDFIAYLYYLDYTRYKNDPKQVEEYFWDRLFKSVKHQSK